MHRVRVFVVGLYDGARGGLTMENKKLWDTEPEWTRKITAEWIAQQRAICDAATPGPWAVSVANEYPYDDIGSGLTGEHVALCGSKNENTQFIITARTVLPAALDALEASMQREADQEKRHMRWNELMSTALVTAEKRAKEKDNIIVRLTAERDALFAYLDTEERLAFKKHQTEKTVSTYDKWVQTVHLFVGVANVVPRDPCAENAPEGRS